MPTYEDIAFKVIVKNDGISDVIFKTMMLKGEAGGTISSIEKTSSVGVVDTYTITLNDGTTTTFEVTNGSNIASIEKTATAGLIDTYTVTLTNGDTSTFEVKNGEDAQLYELPQNCVVGYDHEPTQVTETFVERYIQINNVNGISSVKYNGSTLQETNDGRNLYPLLIGDDSFVNNGSATHTGSGNELIINTSSSSAYSGIYCSNNNGIIQVLTALDGAPRYISFDINSSIDGTEIRVTSGTAQTFTIGTEKQRIAINNIGASISLYVTNKNNAILTVSNFQIERGEEATPYQPYCGGIPAPNPDYPKEIVGVGEKQQDNTYSVDLVAEDADGNVYTVTASGLTYPVYAGDWIDLVAGKLHRANGIYTFDGSERWEYLTDWANKAYRISGANFTSKITNAKVGGDYRTSIYKFVGAYAYWAGIADQGNNIIGTTRSYTGIVIRNDSITDVTAFKNSLIGIDLVYSLENPVEETITLTGDLEQVKRIRGEYVYIDAPLYASTDITFGQETDFPDGYEEIDFPLDDLFYYQDQEYIEFPTSWGFVMGYVFDANEIRFTMNVTKDLKEGFNVVANKSIDLALNLYTGAGGSNLTGFNFVDASFIREYGQIQIRLKTENPHGLTVGSLLGARVSQGRLRITFEEEEEQ